MMPEAVFVVEDADRLRLWRGLRPVAVIWLRRSVADRDRDDDKGDRYQDEKGHRESAVADDVGTRRARTLAMPAVVGVEPRGEPGRAPRSAGGRRRPSLQSNLRTACRRAGKGNRARRSRHRLSIGQWT